MNRVKYPEVDPKSVDRASREEQKQGYINALSSPPAPFFFLNDNETISGKGIPQTDNGGVVGRAHGWER